MKLVSSCACAAKFNLVVSPYMIMETDNQLVKIVGFVTHFRTPIQMSALSFVIIYLVLIGPYNSQQELFVIAVIFLSFIVAIIPEWKKGEVNSELKNRRNDSRAERDMHYNEVSFYARERKKGALGAYNAIMNLIKIKMEVEGLEEDKKVVYQEVLELVEIMKTGVDSFTV